MPARVKRVLPFECSVLDSRVAVADNERKALWNQSFVFGNFAATPYGAWNAY